VKQHVHASLKRKSNPIPQAAALGISPDEYTKIRDGILKVMGESGPAMDGIMLTMLQNSLSGKPLGGFMIEEEDAQLTAFHENLDAKTGKITGLSSTEPRSPEDIIRILKIDTTVWKLSQFWNKEKGNKWLVSALVTRVAQTQVQQDSFLTSLESYKFPQFPPLTPVQIYLNEHVLEKVCGVISMQDLHFGKTGNDDMGKILNDAVRYLIGKAYSNYQLEKIVLVIGPDTLNMDTFDGTTTKGTPVENSKSPTDTYLMAFEAICEAVNNLQQYCQNLEIVFIPGNHDRLSSFHLLHAVAQSFKLCENIIFNTHYAERKVVVYGKSMICMEHGDVNCKNNPLVYAVEFPEQWGICTYRILYTGHYHGRKTKEVITENEEHGFITRIIPALTSTDYYHYHNKYVGNKRSALMHLHDAEKGLISEFTYSL
jgi:hypothetical protein